MGMITGNISESLAVTDWVVTGVSASGLTCTTSASGSTYALTTPSLEPYTVTCSAKVDSAWVATTATALDHYVVPSNPDANPRLYKCTTAGTTGAAEPNLVGTTVVDGTVTWTYVDDIPVPKALGARIPV